MDYLTLNDFSGRKLILTVTLFKTGWQRPQKRIEGEVNTCHETLLPVVGLTASYLSLCTTLPITLYITCLTNKMTYFHVIMYLYVPSSIYFDEYKPCDFYTPNIWDAIFPKCHNGEKTDCAIWIAFAPR